MRHPWRPAFRACAHHMPLFCRLCGGTTGIHSSPTQLTNGSRLAQQATPCLTRNHRRLARELTDCRPALTTVTFGASSCSEPGRPCEGQATSAQHRDQTSFPPFSMSPSQIFKKTGLGRNQHARLRDRQRNQQRGAQDWNMAYATSQGQPKRRTKSQSSCQASRRSVTGFPTCGCVGGLHPHVALASFRCGDVV
ncbi:hypothetical protein BKA80DRAFT_271233 [Phyllosticta citrichinensis]